MIVPMLLGAVLGFGLWCLLRSLVVPTPMLGPALASLSVPRHDRSSSAASTFDGHAQRFGAWILAVTGTDMSGLQCDLAVVDRSEAEQLVQRIKTAVVYAALPTLLHLSPLLLTGSTVFPTGVILVAVLGGLAGGWYGTDAQIRSRAKVRRTEFESTLTTYLGLVSILLAAGAGTQQALQDAVEQGDGWAFGVLRRTLADARIRGISPWEAMGEQGERLNLDALRDLSSTMELAGNSGAHIRESLLTKARALRNHHLADIEREASSRTTAMAGPTGLLMAGFVVLLLYPALAAVLAI